MMVLHAVKKLHISPIVISSVLLLGGNELAWSDETIGGAQAVINTVHGDLPGGNQVPVVQGDSVFLHETVSSGADSKANLVLKDNSNITVGPGSMIKLNDFAYSGPNQPGRVALSVTNGSLRFITGDAAKRGYTIWTPTAAIGLRGTSLRLKATPTETTVVNEEGTAVVCLRKQNEYIPVEQLRRHCGGGEEGKVNLATGNLIGGKNRSCPCMSLLLPSQEATITPSEIALSAAPSDAVSEPFVGPAKDFSLLAADLPTKKEPFAPVAAPAAEGPQIWPFVVGGGLLAAGAAAGIIAASESHSSSSFPIIPITPLSP